MSTGLSGRRILVTGASGFLGSALTERCLTLGAEVYGVSRRAVPASSNGVRWRQLDLSDAAATSQVLGSVRPEIVFHLSAATTAAREIDLVVPLLRDNLQSTVSLLTAAAERGRPKVVLAGSLEECGIDSTATPSSPYAMTKWASTHYGRMFVDLWGVPVTTLRIAMVYGPGQRDIGKLIPYVIRSLLAGAPPRLASGRRKVDWVYVDDVVNAFVAAAQSSAHGAVIDIGSGSSVSIRDVVEMVKEMISPGFEVKFGDLKDRPLDMDWIADISAARKLIGWAPRTDLEQGLRRTVRWYEDMASRMVEVYESVPAR